MGATIPTSTIGPTPAAGGACRLARLAAATMLALGLLLSAAAPAGASPAAPYVRSISPDQGPAAGGTAVTITGENFTAIIAVRFGSREATSFKVVSSTEITAVSPPWGSGNAIAEVTAETIAATSFNSIGDSFIYEPTVTKVEPAYGPAAGGTSVTISGEAFEGLFENGAGEMPPFVSSVKFGSHAAASFKVESEGRITAVSPPGAGTADVTVTTLGGTSATSAADHFAYATAWPTGPPAIEGESVSHITSTDATLEAKIDTEGLETTYEFHIIEERCELCESAAYLFTLPAGRLLGSIVPQSVSADLNSSGVGLMPFDTYWVTASNSAGTTEGPRHAFTAPEKGAQPPNTMQPGSGSSTSISQPSGASAPPPAPTKPGSSAGHRRKHHRHWRRHHRQHARQRRFRAARSRSTAS